MVVYQTLLYRPIGKLLGLQNFGPYENHITFPCVHPLRGPVWESYRYCVRFTSDPKSGLHVGSPWTAIYLAVICGVHEYKFRVHVKLAVVYDGCGILIHRTLTHPVSNRVFAGSARRLPVSKPLFDRHGQEKLISCNKFR